LERRFHRRHAHGMARPHQWRYGRYPYRYGRRGVPAQGVPAAGGYTAPGAAPGYAGGVYAGPGRVARPRYGVPTGQAVSPGQVVGGQCSCATGQAATAPAYCGCCGQPLR
jgi:hypothetical protein